MQSKIFTMQKWFSADQQTTGTAATTSSSPSLLADWNSYAASRESEESTSSSSLLPGFDLESAVKSANDTVSGTFNV